MALKIALFAALCVAQAFAFQPSFMGFGQNLEEDGQPRRDMNYEVFVDCFKHQRVEVRELGDVLSETPEEFLKFAPGHIKAIAALYLKRLQEPLENIAYTMIDGHRVVFNYFRKYEVKNASKEAMERMKQIASDLEVVRGELQKGIEEVPDMELFATWVFRDLLFKIETAKTSMRKSFGKCLAERRILPL